ncbi:MAG TPA: hypothetical protein PLA25_05105 [Anaerolineaceae bacterium]|jgi:hypothetical protein|nr:hypothetical protein [Longilinea sp.]HQN43489.1 hypothetical protein [Anaerolineaceae bacterium]
MSESIKTQSPQLCAWCAHRKGDKQITIEDQWTFTDSVTRQSHAVSAVVVVQQCPECENFIKRLKPFEIIVDVLGVISFIGAVVGQYFSMKSGNWLLLILLWLYILYGIAEIMLFNRKGYLKSFLMGLIIKIFLSKTRPDGYSFSSTKCFRVMRDEKVQKNYILFSNPEFQVEFEKLNPELAKP